MSLACLLALCLVAMALPLSGACSPGGAGQGQGTVIGRDAAGNPVYAPTDEIVVATMATEDLLPLWVAEREGAFEKRGIRVRIETFQSAQELMAAIASGEADFAMTDPLVAATLSAAGTPVVMEWVTLGATSQQGRFGIMTTPDSGIKTLRDLAGKPIGVGQNTLLEYVMDQLMLDAGIPADLIVAEQVPKIPVRFELMRSGKVAAAVLPGTMLALGEKEGMVTVAEDSYSRNLSQSVMVSRADFSRTSQGEAVTALLRFIWDEAVAKVNGDPLSFRGLLVESASLPEAIQESFPISAYPKAARPTAAMIDPLLAWMLAKGYLKAPLSYDPMTGMFKEA
ncbi:MAG: ABC transporter substrate-binding protein [Coriobacteriales bacterium]|jgi:NitT/TauT family transport system substrate-binding protein|nr:ABC transporter substrate-binding protein [Coriobacteriales bacterium]